MSNYKPFERDKMTTEEAIKILDKFTTENKLFNIKHSDGLEEAIETLLTAYEKEKEKNKELYEIKYIASRFINRSMKQFSIGEFKYKVNNFIEWEDKIKAKIEEYKKQIKKMEKDDVGIGGTLGKEWSDLKAKIEFGQSLLEEKE